MGEIENLVVKETPETFFNQVEDVVWDKDVTWLEATIQVIKKNNYEADLVKKLINSQLKGLLYREAQKLNLVKKEFEGLF